MQVLSVNVGPVQPWPIDGETVLSGIVKQPVPGPVMMHKLGLDGDGIGNTKHHGGPDQAVYAYAAEHYDAWSRELNRNDLTYGIFGENLTVRGWLDQAVCIGDTYRVGSAIVRVTGPRIPCAKLDWRLDERGFSKKFADSRRFGIYLRVLEPGEVCAGDEVALIEKSPSGLGLIELAELFLYRPRDAEAMRRALGVQGLSARCQAKFRERIAACRDA